MSAPPALIHAPLVDLRRAKPDDAPSLFDLASDAEVMRFMDWPMPAAASETRAHLEEAQVSWDTGIEYQWIILERQTGVCAGTIALRIKDHAADFGYFLGRTFWGRGLGFDAANAVLQWLDTQPRILLIRATTDTENLRSRRLLERLGLQLEGIMRCATLRPNIGGPPRDTATYGRSQTIAGSEPEHLNCSATGETVSVRVVPYDKHWPAQYETEAQRIHEALSDVTVAIHHMGSTSVPGLCAKPVIDILIETTDLAALDARTQTLESLGYEAKGEFGIPGRRYFRRDDASGVRTHQIHAFVSSWQIDRHLAFRDYLISHPRVSQAYGILKQQLAARFPHDIDAYMDGKDSFIKQHEAEALAWRRQAT